MDGKLFFMKSLLYIYDPKDNHWRSLRVYSTPSFYTVDVFLAQNTTTFLLGKCDKNKRTRFLYIHLLMLNLLARYAFEGYGYFENQSCERFGL